MFGLSKSDKEEILEFPRKYGVILEGMHRDLAVMQGKVEEYKALVNKYIAHSKDLQTKFDEQIGKAEKAALDVRSFGLDLENRVNAKLHEVKSVRDYINRIKREIDQGLKDIDLLKEWIKDNKKSIQENHSKLSTSIDELNAQMQTSQEEIKELVSSYQSLQKRTWRLEVLVYIVIVGVIFSLILHVL